MGWGAGRHRRGRWPGVRPLAPHLLLPTGLRMAWTAAPSHPSRRGRRTGSVARPLPPRARPAILARTSAVALFPWAAGPWGARRRRGPWAPCPRLRRGQNAQSTVRRGGGQPGQGRRPASPRLFDQSLGPVSSPPSQEGNRKHPRSLQGSSRLSQERLDSKVRPGWPGTCGTRLVHRCVVPVPTPAPPRVCTQAWPKQRTDPEATVPRSRRGRVLRTFGRKCPPPATSARKCWPPWPIQPQVGATVAGEGGRP